MAAPRILLATLLSCTAAVAAVTGLAACTPADSDPTVVTASAEVDEADDDGLGDPTDAADGTVEAAPPAPSVPTAPSAPGGCAVVGEHPGHRVLQVVAVDSGELTALATRYVCGDKRFEAVGSPARYGFAAAGVDATLVDAAQPVPLSDLLTHLDDCLANGQPARPYGCFGNTYDVVLDSHGRIMRIAELARP
ncbi:hypothetical protein [Kitasatospora aureofaciens]|uniref:hypothetical protein n=1 Tax=Kitasatospora aureofaciens TaxID=1894 RepID=UPI00380041A1